MCSDECVVIVVCGRFDLFVDVGLYVGEYFVVFWCVVFLCCWCVVVVFVVVVLLYV